jgi:hypothetical protein
MARTAQAAVYEAPNGPFILKTYPLRAARAGEVRVRVSMATICRSDIHSYEGRRPNPCPGILGHEIIVGGQDGDLFLLHPWRPDQAGDVAGELSVRDRLLQGLVQYPVRMADGAGRQGPAVLAAAGEQGPCAKWQRRPVPASTR